MSEKHEGVRGISADPTVEVLLKQVTKTKGEESEVKQCLGAHSSRLKVAEAESSEGHNTHKNSTDNTARDKLEQQLTAKVRVLTKVVNYPQSNATTESIPLAS